MTEPVLERFHRALIEEIQTQRPEYLTQPFTVAEIYQNLVPYGSHRDRIGVEMNGDYEDALVRLLAGEGGYLLLESEPALKKLQAELDRQNPNTGIYREYAAVDVRLNQAYLDLSSEALDELPDLVEELEAEDPVSLTDLAPSEGNASAGSGVTPPGGDIFAEYVPEADGGSEASDAGAAASGSDAAAAGPPAAGDAAASGEAGSPGEAAEVDTPAGDDTEPAAAGARPSPRPPLDPEYVQPPSRKAPSGGGGSPGDRKGVADGSCVWCRAELPGRDDVNYCPFCGTDLRLFPCGSCGAEIEPGWIFCAACGSEVDG